MDSRRVPHAAVALAAAAILALTLVPDRRAERAAQETRLGSEQWYLADVLRNLVLFAPLGASLAWSRLRAPHALLIGAGLSAFVELTQFAIPGRNSSPIDWISNVSGVGLAVFLFRTGPSWLHPPEARSGTLALVAGAAVAATLAGTGVLFAPSPTAATFYAHHTPVLGNLAVYGGTVLDAAVDEIAIPVGEIRDSDRVRARLRGNHSLRVDGLAGTPPGDLAAFVLITDTAQDDILLLGPDRGDLVYRFRSRAQPLGFERAQVRLPHALDRVVPGNRFSLAVARIGDDLCFTIDGAVDCGHGFTVGDGWQLLVPEMWIPAGWHPIAAAAWLAALFVPLGYWGRMSWPTHLACAAAAAALVFAPAGTALLRTPVLQLAGAGLGALFGAALRLRLERHARQHRVGR